MNFLEQIENIIRINSVSQNGNEEIAVYLQALMGKMGFQTKLQEVAHSLEGVSKRQFNVIGTLGDPLVDSKTKKGLLLNTHIDTVGPGLKSNWTETGGDPFKATFKNGKIFGLGTTDVKLDFLCKLKACERYKDRKLKMPIYLVGTAAEEIGMIGAKFLIKSKIVNPKYVIVGEPSELSVIYAHKAYCVYQVSVGYAQLERDAKGFNTRIGLQCFGKSAHGSYPHLGENAIKRVIQTMQKIKSANFQVRQTRMMGGDAVNKVPDSAAIEFYLQSSSFDDFRRYYRDNLSQENIRVEFGGLGESGVKFLPDSVLDVVEGISGLLDGMSDGILAPQDDTFNPSSSSVNFGRVSCRPGTVDMFFDIRLLPQVSPEEFDAHFKQSVQTLNARYPNLSVKVMRTRFNPALNTSLESELVRVAKDSQQLAGIPEKVDKKATSTEAAQYYQAGFDAIVFGPGVSHGNSHSPNEYNIVEHLDKAVQFYDRMIERFCI